MKIQKTNNEQTSGNANQETLSSFIDGNSVLVKFRQTLLDAFESNDLIEMNQTDLALVLEDLLHFSKPAAIQCALILKRKFK